MTRQEKNILTALVLANVFLFCCLAPNLILFFDVGNSQQEIRLLLAAIIPTPRASATAKATPAPTRPPPTPALEAGWKLYPVPTEGFTVALPSSWEQFPASDANAFKTAIASLEKKNAKLAGVLKYTPSNALVKLFAVDTVANMLVDNGVPNITILRRPDSPTGTLDEYGSMAIDQFKQLLGPQANTMTNRRVKLPTGDAEWMRGRVIGKRPDGTVADTTITQYLMIRGKDIYLITFGNPPKLDAKCFPVQEKIVNTFQWTSK